MLVALKTWGHIFKKSLNLDLAPDEILFCGRARIRGVRSESEDPPTAVAVKTNAETRANVSTVTRKQKPQNLGGTTIIIYLAARTVYIHTYYTYSCIITSSRRLAAVVLPFCSSGTHIRHRDWVYYIHIRILILI